MIIEILIGFGIFAWGRWYLIDKASKDHTKDAFYRWDPDRHRYKHDAVVAARKGLKPRKAFK